MKKLLILAAIFLNFATTASAAEIVVSQRSRTLTLYQDDGSVKRYSVAVGKPGFQWHGTHTIGAKQEWPAWTPPPAMLKRKPYLPHHMAGGRGNPLGARAMYISGTLYRIHGTNEPSSIGRAASSGCIRMRNADVVDLYNRVAVGTTITVQ